MASLILVMDENNFSGRTDVMVIVDPAGKSCVWVPRDLWSPLISERINAVFKRGRHALIFWALKEHKLFFDHSLCFSRNAVERCLEGVRITVPVTSRLEFIYPLHSTAPIEEGSRRIVFNPPAECLSGERIHQWIGARSTPLGQWRGGDLNRIERQMIFVQSLLEQGADVSAVFDKTGQYSCTNLSFVVNELKQITPEWTFDTFMPLCVAKIDGKDVFVNPAHLNVQSKS